MRHLVAFNQFALPRSQGGITRHADLLIGLDNWQVNIVAGDRNYNTQKRYRSRDENFKLVRVPESNGTPIRRLITWVTYCVQAAVIGTGRRKCDAIFASTPQLLAPLMGLAVSKLRRVPFILEVRDLWPEMFVTTGVISRQSITFRVLSAIERLVVRGADAIVVVTDGWEEHFRSLGADMSSYFVISNGSLQVRKPDSSERKNLRMKHGLSGTTAIYAGAHGFANGLVEVLDAAAEHSQINFLLVGSGQEKNALIDSAEVRGLTNIEFRDPMSKDQLLDLLSVCDIGVHCLRPYDTLQKGMSPNKLFDYMGAGLPVVSNAGSSATAILGDSNQLGIAVSSGELAAGIDQMLGMSESDRQEMANRAYREIAERYSLDAMRLRMREVLEKTLQHRVNK